MQATNPYPAGSPEFFMQTALELANEGLGWTSPNPLVGCVLVRDGRIIGRGSHLRDGEEHAEVRAIADAGDARGATAYVTLEPCSHQGRQPACCKALAAAGVTTVHWGCDDANPITAGRARVVLAGLGVTAGALVLQDQCTEFLDYYNTATGNQRLFMHLKLALSADGKVACPSGHSQWLSNPIALGYAHYLRLKYDAILVGYRTAFHDDPRLTVRAEALANYREPPTGELRQPVRIILDPRFATLDKLALARFADFTAGTCRAELPRLIIAGNACHLPDQAPAIQGLELLGLTPGPRGLLDFSELSTGLWQFGIRSVLVEGGGGLAAELIDQELADKLTLVYTPTLIGGDGLAFTKPHGHQRIQHCPVLSPCRAYTLANNAVLEGYPIRHPTGGTSNTL